MSAVQSLLPWGNTKPWQDHGSITEQFKCQVLQRKCDARMFFPSQNMQRGCHSPPATTLFAPGTQLSQSHIGATLRTELQCCNTVHPIRDLASPNSTDATTSQRKSNNRTCKTKEITYIISHLNEDDSEWCKKKQQSCHQVSIHSTAPTVCFLEPHVNSRALTSP